MFEEPNMMSEFIDQQPVIFSIKSFNENTRNIQLPELVIPVAKSEEDSS